MILNSMSVDMPQRSKILRVAVGVMLLALPLLLSAQPAGPAGPGPGGPAAKGPGGPGGPPTPPAPPAAPPKAPTGQTLDISFATKVATSATEAPGVWYPDRYAPCAFTSPATAPDGTKSTLEQSICATDFQGQPNFYATQGRKYDLPAGTYSTSIALYVPSTWATDNARMAGFWATVFDTSNSVGDYPIIEFQGAITSGEYPNGGVPGFYGWDNNLGVFDLIGLPAGFKYNTWVTLTIELVPGKGFQYTVTSGKNGVSVLSPLSDTADAAIGNVILEGYNYDVSYNIFWNNLTLTQTSLVCSK